jgi:HK97 family phage portal protein
MYINPGGNAVIWSSEDYVKLASETFMKNVIAYQCINMISRAVSSVPWFHMIKNMDGDQREVVNSPISHLFTKANIYESWRFFLYKTNCYYLCEGDAYIKRVKVGSGKIQEVHSLRPDRIQVKKNQRNQITGYIYQEDLQDQEIFDMNLVTGDCDLLHLKTFHPLDDYFGMSPSQPLSREIDISNEATRWNMHMMVNDARPGMLVLVKGFLPDDKYDQMEKVLKEAQSGSHNAGKSLILESEEGIADVKPYSWSPKEIDFIEGGRETARRIAIGYGVPSMLLGIPGDNTYSNYKEARAAFWEDTIIHYLDFYREAFTGWFFNRNITGQYIEYDLNDIPALAYKQELLWERQKNATDILTIDERRMMIGYDPLPNGIGDHILSSTALMPLEYVIEPPEPPPDMTPSDEEGDEEEEE